MKKTWILLLTILASVCMTMVDPGLGSVEPLWTYPIGGTVHVAVSSDGRYIAAASSIEAGWGGVYLFSSDGILVWSYKDDNIGIKSIAISSDGKYIVAGEGNIGGDPNCRIFLFARESGTPIWSYQAGSTVWSVAISSDGAYIAAASWDRKAYLFSRESGNPLWTYETDRALTVNISSDGNYVAAGGYNGVVFFGRSSSTPLWTHGYDDVGIVRAVAMSSDGQYVAGAADGVSALFSGTGNKIWGSQISSSSSAISADGSYAVIGGGLAGIYLVRRGSQQPTWQYQTGTGVESVAISSDGSFVAAGGADQQVYLFNRDSGIPISSYRFRDVVWSVALSSSGEYMAVGAAAAVFLFGRETGASGKTTSSELAPTSQVIATGTHTVTGGQESEAVLGIAPWIALVAIVALIGFFVTRKRESVRRPAPTTAVIVPNLFDISVSVPSLSKTVTLEAGADHTLGSLVETIVTTLSLPENRTYAIEHTGKLISQPEFDKTLGNLGIREASKLTLRVVE